MLKQREFRTQEEKELASRIFNAKWTGCLILAVLAAALSHHFFPKEWVGYSITAVFILIGICMFAPEWVIMTFWNLLQSIRNWEPASAAKRR